MIATSVKYRGHRCFTKDFVGFETIKPVNVIIGKNNTGKSHLLDFAESLCGESAQNKTSGWECQCEGVLKEDDLHRVFGQSAIPWTQPLHGHPWKDYGALLVGATVSWDVDSTGTVKVTKLPQAVTLHNRGETVTRVYEERISAILKNAKPPLSGRRFRRLVADRDIQPESATLDRSLSSNGGGATNLIRRFEHSTSTEVDAGIIEGKVLHALNEIFQSDGHFNKLEVKHHDEKQTEERDTRWELFLAEEKKNLVPLSASGSGLKTVILVLLNLLVVPHSEKRAPKDYVFAFEELENNLHPALLRRLFQYLEQFARANETTFFLTTHSSVALDVFGLSEHAQIIRVTQENGSAKAERITAHFDQQAVISELGAKPSDLLQANGILWVEGPSDRIYLTRWIELLCDGELREGRDYQCAFYGGALLARMQFTSPEEADIELANLLRLNHNIIVVCDSDRTAKTGKGSILKNRVQRIEEEVLMIPRAHIWITHAKEIENYIPGPVLIKALSVDAVPDPDQFERFFPPESARKRQTSFVQKHLKRKTIDKVELALKASPHMTKELLAKRFDWADQLRSIVEKIRSWN
ncbi:MAG: ATP-binding protein [Nitrospira sp.]|nr:MAG: ATP-binding protein [Nitrospira sp.]